MGPIAATAMSVTIVVGAGLLTLPGLSFAEAGRLGHLPWLLMALIMLPLLGIFACPPPSLGRRRRRLRAHQPG